MGKMDIGLLEKITEQVIESIEKGKQEIFDISETARQEVNKVKQVLNIIDDETKNIIELVDKTELLERKARIRLMEVSKNFSIQNQDIIQKAYDTAHQLKVDLILYRQKEKNLVEKRNELQIRLKGLEKMVEKSEHLINHVSVALDYLMTNLKSVSDQLIDYQQQKNVGYRIIQAQETERKRVARDIHDGPAQSIADVIINTEFVEKVMSVNPVQAREELGNIKSKVRETLQEIRRIIHQLRPMGLDDLGLIPTLQRYCEDFAEKNHLQVEFVVFGKEKRFENLIEVTLFRIVQEALQNIYKHSKATKTMVKIEIEKNITVMIKDNGKGFDADRVLTDVKAEKYGILGMKERVDLLKGDFEVNSVEGRGTTIVVRIPQHLEGEDL
ncbi:sensor histidine kinase [Alkalicella caledoniensis]|uniref:histidine kinase n=1 Tax=Alkalicella caledoniensis TaxID=2731377 RepID=A0A7G9W727_ALKCA|nr:sensor histidine kinase [Alkalicella caledoniensis]QNO14489.1 sensor histidine kinase [Alkalicella caledoniensis]